MIEINYLPVPVLIKPAVPKISIPNWVWALFGILIVCIILNALGVFETVFNTEKKPDQEEK